MFSKDYIVEGGPEKRREERERGRGGAHKRKRERE